MTRRKRIYISGPISKGDLAANIRQADAAMLKLMKAGMAPFNPMLSCYAGACERDPVFDYVFAEATRNSKLDGLTAEDWYGMDLAWVEVSDAVLRLPGESKGAEGEVAHATKRLIPVFHDADELIGWAEGLTVRS